MRLGRGRETVPMKVKDLILNLRIDPHRLYTKYTRLPEKNRKSRSSGTPDWTEGALLETPERHEPPSSMRVSVGTLSWNRPIRPSDGTLARLLTCSKNNEPIPR